MQNTQNQKPQKPEELKQQKETDFEIFWNEFVLRRKGGILRMVIINQERKKGMRLGKYELGRILGEGNFGKVKLARNTDSGQLFAVKIIEKNKIIDHNNADQV